MLCNYTDMAWIWHAVTIKHSWIRGHYGPKSHSFIGQRIKCYLQCDMKEKQHNYSSALFRYTSQHCGVLQSNVTDDPHCTELLKFIIKFSSSLCWTGSTGVSCVSASFSKLPCTASSRTSFSKSQTPSWAILRKTKTMLMMSQTLNNFKTQGLQPLFKIKSGTLCSNKSECDNLITFNCTVSPLFLWLHNPVHCCWGKMSVSYPWLLFFWLTDEASNF